MEAAEKTAALEAARERERAGRRTYRLVYGGRFGAWPVLSGRDLRSAPLTDLREGDGAVAPGGADASTCLLPSLHTSARLGLAPFRPVLLSSPAPHSDGPQP